MSATDALLEKVPEHWASMVRPFLQRAREFEEREPLVAYFLCTHVAFLCMQHRRKEDKVGTAFLMTLLEALEASKVRLAAQLDGVDGRTTLTRFALMLFARADDAERTGNASLTIVRIFYSASVLFEATVQFTDDGQMDPIAAQKCKYAKYIATRMKKALDSKEPYVSPNKIEPVEGGTETGNLGSGNFTTMPANCFAPPPPSNPASALSKSRANLTSSATTTNSAKEVAAPPTFAQPPPPAYTYDSGSPNRSSPAPPGPPPLPSSAFPPPSATAGSTASSNKSSTVSSSQRFGSGDATHNFGANTNTTLPALPPVSAPPPQQQQRPAAPAMSSHGNNNNNNGNASGTGAGFAGSGGNFKPTVDQMIDAQKFAGRAVSALQFYDYDNAKKQLISALQILNGVHS